MWASLPILTSPASHASCSGAETNLPVKFRYLLALSTPSMICGSGLQVINHPCAATSPFLRRNPAADESSHLQVLLTPEDTCPTPARMATSPAAQDCQRRGHSGNNPGLNKKMDESPSNLSAREATLYLAVCSSDNRAKKAPSPQHHLQVQRTGKATFISPLVSSPSTANRSSFPSCYQIFLL